jgi:hypothetical protein
MPVVSVQTTGTTLVAADVDNQRIVILENLDPTNYVEIEIGSIPAAGTGLKLNPNTIMPEPIRLPPNTIIGARANTAAVNVAALSTP